MHITKLQSATPRASAERGFISELCHAAFASAMLLLGEAASYAERTKSDRWEFAVEIQRLFELGVREHDLRFLIRMKLVTHASEVKVLGRNGRTYKQTGDLSFTQSTCFVLTDSGRAVANELLAMSSRGKDSVRRLPQTINTGAQARLKPQWDANFRVLKFGEEVIKQFRVPAENQEIILAVFQEEDWPKRIDDPLTPASEVDEKRRLNDAIKCLNRSHRHKAIRFRGDGTGQGIIWEILSLSLGFILQSLEMF